MTILPTGKVFDSMLNNYNGVEGKPHGYYKFDSIKVVSAGERDPDAEGVEGSTVSFNGFRTANCSGTYPIACCAPIAVTVQ